MDLATTYDAIRISSGNSFVHETEGQVILNGSRDIGFTLDLVAKDLGLFQAVADRAGVPLELSPLLGGLVADAMARYGPREWSPNIIRGLEEVTGIDVHAAGFPAELVDLEPPGHRDGGAHSRGRRSHERDPSGLTPDLGHPTHITPKPSEGVLLVNCGVRGLSGPARHKEGIGHDVQSARSTGTLCIADRGSPRGHPPAGRPRRHAQRPRGPHRLPFRV